ncbi:TetR/AcrR family transcriptional regulator [Planococcus sp. 1R117A]|uniref:TetR/AcrR family transcriptional regulator n=1 Tax=Planococcus sp. 1R117A TaxID=3447020 RepID=UPI003EDC6809
MKDEILHTALSYFANEGYEGASLGKIAEAVGIKKPSIYAHYSGKDDLFFSAMEYALKSERRHLATYFTDMKNEPLEVLLLGYFEWFIKDLEGNEHMKFILRTMYFPPARLEKEIAEVINPLFDQMHRHLTRVFRERERREKILYSDDFSSCSLAFITVIEGTITELVYSGTAAYRKRFEAVWPIFWRGLVK